MTMMPWAASLPRFIVPQLVFGHVWVFLKSEIGFGQSATVNHHPPTHHPLDACYG